MSKIELNAILEVAIKPPLHEQFYLNLPKACRVSKFIDINKDKQLILTITYNKRFNQPEDRQIKKFYLLKQRELIEKNICFGRETVHEIKLIFDDVKINLADYDLIARFYYQGLKHILYVHRDADII